MQTNDRVRVLERGYHCTPITQYRQNAAAPEGLVVPRSVCHSIEKMYDRRAGYALAAEGTDAERRG